MEKEKEAEKNRPAYYGEHEIKATIEKYIESMNEKKPKGKDKEKKGGDKMIPIPYLEIPYFKKLCKQFHDAS